MPHLLALEWNSRDIQVAMASGRDRSVVIEDAFSVPWNAEGASIEHPEQRIAEQLVKELDARGMGRPDVLVAVGRTSIELRQIQLPPAPDEELPELVRFQAAREFNELDDRWRLDFVPIDETADGARTVLAMAIAPAIIEQVEAVCEQAGLKMKRLLLRPCEAASLLAGDKAARRGELRLLVDLLAEEADLTAVVDGKAVFLRTTRFGGDPPPVPALLAEIRLTMAAVQNQLSGKKIQSIALCGRADVHADLAKRIEAELGMDVELFDPFGPVELGLALRDSPPENPGRFAPVLGMLLAELRQTGHAIDFLHPRQRAAAPSKRRKYIIGTVAAVVLGLAYLVYARVDYFKLASEVRGIKAECTKLDDDVAKLKKTRENVKDIRKWTDSEVIWLDRLYDLNKGFPPNEDVVLGDLTFNVQVGGSQLGGIVLKGKVRDPSVLTKMGESIRAQGGQLNITKQDQLPVKGPQDYYTVSFEAKVPLKKGPKS